jgi:hypothetical protein
VFTLLQRQVRCQGNLPIESTHSRRLVELLRGSLEPATTNRKDYICNVVVWLKSTINSAGVEDADRIGAIRSTGDQNISWLSARTWDHTLNLVAEVGHVYEEFEIAELLLG